jgi:hypothetical protein
MKSLHASVTPAHSPTSLTHCFHCLLSNIFRLSAPRTQIVIFMYDFARGVTPGVCGGVQHPQCCNIAVLSGNFSNFNDTLVGKKTCNSAKNVT